MIRFIAFIIIHLASFDVMAGNLTQEDLVGMWVPSGEMPREDHVSNYMLVVDKNLSAIYSTIDNTENNNIELNCSFKQSSSQDTIFVYYCFLKEKHLITLALGGRRTITKMLLYGYEYWLGYPSPGEIHGGLPVSLSRVESKS